MVKLFFDRTPDPPPPPAAPQAPMPEGLRQFADMINAFMPTVETMTGLNRREITLQLLKTGFRGGNMDTFLNSLMGKPPVQDAKFIRYVKTLAIWVPIALFLIGFSLITLVLYAKFIMQLIGG